MALNRPIDSLIAVRYPPIILVKFYFYCFIKSRLLDISFPANNLINVSPLFIVILRERNIVTKAQWSVYVSSF
jgi:hypothetical protein